MALSEQEREIDATLDRVRSQVHEFETLLENVDTQLQKLVAEKPMWVLGGTLLAGFVAGRLLARK